jgi:hypothetical protein
LAAAAAVTQSYVSQLLTRKKLPPAPDRTDIYEKMEAFLELPRGNLANLAQAQRMVELKRVFQEPPRPLFQEVRKLILRKCQPERREDVSRIFEQQPFGEIERLVTQKLLDVIKRVARGELDNEKWLRAFSRVSGRSYKQMRVEILDFLETEVFDVSAGNCASFLDPLIESWDIDLSTFSMEIVLNRRLVPERLKKIGFFEREPNDRLDDEPGLVEFLQDTALSGNVSQDEIEFLRTLRVRGKRPNRLYYYRELQNLRDPVHFSSVKPDRR